MVVFLVFFILIVAFAAKRMQEKLAPLRIPVGINRMAIAPDGGGTGNIHLRTRRNIMPVHPTFNLSPGKAGDENEVHESRESFERFDRKFRVLKIVLNTYQTLSNSPVKFSIHLTPTLAKLYNVLRNVNLDFIGLLPISCVVKFDYQDAMVTLSA